MKPAESYILKQTEPYKTILLHLQAIIESVAPESELLYKWNIPFYYCNGIPLCFLNKSKDYVDLGFWHFKHMEKFEDRFVEEKRKSIRSLRYKTLEAIEDEVVVYIIQKQLEINLNPFKLILNSKKK